MFKMMTKGDKILIFAILALSVASIFAIPRLLTTVEEGKMVVVNLDGTVIHRFPLEESPEAEFLEFPFEVRGQSYTGKIEMKDGRVMLHRLSDDISPLSIHTDMGWISESYQMIVSLPIRLIITIEEEDPPEYDFDIISY
ncbi:conserved hypothetical protein [Alkaliphilus metalliredigens QYMF]|uniref:Uncharacterized protein n=1 Tax=Alkaliphilus metalliredigens (strain QYMF) TaxID=293826 RepID=A6TK67_ALKMQ|nr:NusG domain II-containing protein [Alkaliphilus metalliredigens]ABR46585.1 conserved hypothetical protein [Alkaliphilus metalliredigens QYMF]